MSDRKPPTTDQELTARVAALEQQVAALTGRVDGLEVRVEVLETAPVVEPPPVIEPPPETGTEIATFQVKNTGSDALTDPQISFAHPLGPGAVASDQHVALLLEDGTSVHCQQDQESTWAQDGSWKVATLSFIHPGTIAAGATVAYRLYAGTGAPNRYPTVALEGLAARSDFKLRFTGFDLGEDIFEVRVNDIMAEGMPWPWGDNPMLGYEVVRAGPVCCEWRFWCYLRRVGDGAYHKWLKGWVYVRAWSAAGPFEVAAGVRQSNILGPSPEGTVGAEPEPKHVFDVQVLNGETVIHYWGGPNDPRVQHLNAPADFPANQYGHVTFAPNNTLVNDLQGGMAVTLTGTVGAGLSTDTLYWIRGFPEYGTHSLQLSRHNVFEDYQPIIYTPNGQGAIDVVPHCHCYPFTGQMYLAPDARPFWVGGARPTIAVKHDFDYLTKTSLALPPYIGGVTVDDIPEADGLSHSPGQQFYQWDLNESGAGQQDERISYNNLSEARAIYNPFDENNNRRCRVIAASFAEQHIYMEDETSGTVPVLNNGPARDGVTYQNLGVCRPAARFYPFHTAPLLTPSLSAADKDGLYERYTQYMGQGSHCPLPGQIPYLQTGDDYWREYMLQLANLAVGSHIVVTQPVAGTVYHRPQATRDTQTRGIAWNLRILGQAQHFMPAAHPLAAYWSDTMADNAAYIDAWWQTIAEVGGDGRVTNAGTTPTYATMGMPGWWAEGVWQMDLVLLTMGMEAGRNEFPGWRNFIDNYYHQSVVGRYDPAVGNGGCRWVLGHRNIWPWYPTSYEEDTSANLLQNWDDIFQNVVLIEGTSQGMPDPWACPGEGLAPDPGGSSIDQPNSLVNYGTAGLAVWAALAGGGRAVELYNEIRAIQYPAGLDFTNFPNWAIGPAGNQERL